MADIEEVSGGLKKAFSGKSVGVFVAVGAALGAVTLLMKSGSGSGSTSTDSGGTASQETQALAQVIQQNQAATNQMFQQQQADSKAALQALSDSNTSQLQAITDSMKEMTSNLGSGLQTLAANETQLVNQVSANQTQTQNAINDLKTAQQALQGQVSDVYSNVHSIQYAASSPSYSYSGGGAPSYSYSSGGSPATSTTPSKPTVTVKAGSAEAGYLRAEYGDSINIVESSANQFVGSDRTQTNAMYQSVLAAQGVTAKNPLTGTSDGKGNLWNY